MAHLVYCFAAHSALMEELWNKVQSNYDEENLGSRLASISDMTLFNFSEKQCFLTVLSKNSKLDYCVHS